MLFVSYWSVILSCVSLVISGLAYIVEFSGSLLPLIFFVLPPVAIIIIQYNWSRGSIAWALGLTDLTVHTKNKLRCEFHTTRQEVQIYSIWMPKNYIL